MEKKAAQNMCCLLFVLSDKREVKDFGDKIRCLPYLWKSDIPGVARSDIFLSESDMKASRLS